jgi:BirA family biotin operon repressor/biotin-[acetyl-CoA-carboxylase] ligase
MTDFAAQGFVAFADDWRKHDWLHGRDIMVDLAGRQISGIAAGVDSDGALLVDTENSQARVISGSVVVNG